MDVEEVLRLGSVLLEELALDFDECLGWRTQMQFPMEINQKFLWKDFIILFTL